MGMAASQARFLQLTARKTNIEYMGQQINQERLALANESAGLFEKQLTMVPPTPPSSLDDSYYTPAYIFTDTDGIQKKITSWTGVATTGFDVDYDYDLDGTPGSDTFTVTAAMLNEDAAGDLTLSILQDAGLAHEDATTLLSRQVTYSYDAYQPDGTTTTNTATTDALMQFDNEGRLVDILFMTGQALSGVLDDPNQNAALGAGVADFSSFASIEASESDGHFGGDALMYSPEFDQTAFDNDMNEYEYEKATYDYEIEQINLETAKIQKQDKSLELKLKQLDTEHNAIQTEMDAVQKVLTKNIESSFKTFS